MHSGALCIEWTWIHFLVIRFFLKHWHKQPDVFLSVSEAYQASSIASCLAWFFRLIWLVHFFVSCWETDSQWERQRQDEWVSEAYRQQSLKTALMQSCGKSCTNRSKFLTDRLTVCISAAKQTCFSASVICWCLHLETHNWESTCFDPSLL